MRLETEDSQVVNLRLRSPDKRDAKSSMDNQDEEVGTSLFGPTGRYTSAQGNALGF